MDKLLYDSGMIMVMGAYFGWLEAAPSLLDEPAATAREPYSLQDIKYYYGATLLTSVDKYYLMTAMTVTNQGIASLALFTILIVRNKHHSSLLSIN